MRVVASVIVFAAIAAACGGATETNLFGDIPDGGAAGSTTSSSGAGTPGTSGGTSGTSGTSGGTSSSTSSSSSSGDAGPIDSGADTGPGDRRCNVGADPCASGEYCKVEGCGTIGACARRPDEGPRLFEPVCGCDNVTYWNAGVAANHGMNVALAGACNVGVPCTRDDGCKGDAKCNLEQVQACQVAGPARGVCWVLPETCEGAGRPLVRRCNSNLCLSMCMAVEDQRQFLPGPNCP